jgi:hypothetical protein
MNQANATGKEKDVEMWHARLKRMLEPPYKEWYRGYSSHATCYLRDKSKCKSK